MIYFNSVDERGTTVIKAVMAMVMVMDCVCVCVNE